MKTWTAPIAVAGEFAADEYVSACYSVICTTPHGNAKYTHVYIDSNGNGTLDLDSDAVFCDIKADFDVDWFRGCNRRHDVVILGDLPSNNGFVYDSTGNNPTAPYFFWNGSVIGDTDPNKMYTDDVHGTDLSRADAIIPADNPNHS